MAGSINARLREFLLASFAFFDKMVHSADADILLGAASGGVADRLWRSAVL
jgi:hypothetical protein